MPLWRALRAAATQKLPSPRAARVRSAWKTPLKLAITGALITVLIHDHVVEVARIDGSSMSPTLSPLYHATGASDRVLFAKYLPTLHMRRGDVVLFWAPDVAEHVVVKRVVALEGDVVHLDRRRWRARFYGKNMVEGQVEEEETEREIDEGMRRMAATGWRVTDGQQDEIAGERRAVGTQSVVLGVETGRDREKTVEVPPGHVWVEGDNWRATTDSNTYGPISRGLIIGRAVCLTRPWDRFGEKPWEATTSKTRIDRGPFEPPDRDR